MASMKQALDTVLKRYKRYKHITMPTLAIMAIREFIPSIHPQFYVLYQRAALRMIRRQFKIEKGRGGGVVNPFYKPGAIPFITINGRGVKVLPNGEMRWMKV